MLKSSNTFQNLFSRIFFFGVGLFVFLQLLSLPFGFLTSTNCPEPRIDSEFGYIANGSNCYISAGMPAPFFFKIIHTDVQEFLFKNIIFNLIVSLLVVVIFYLTYEKVRFKSLSPLINDILGIIAFILSLSIFYYSSEYVLGSLLENTGFYEHAYTGGGFILGSEPKYLFLEIFIFPTTITLTILQYFTVFLLMIILLLSYILTKNLKKLFMKLQIKYKPILLFLYLAVLIFLSIGSYFMVNILVVDLPCRHANTSTCDG